MICHFESTNIEKVDVDAFHLQMDTDYTRSLQRCLQIAKTVYHSSTHVIQVSYTISTCNASITIRFIFAACQTGSIKWITCLINTEWTARILAVFPVRFITCYKITYLLENHHRVYIFTLDTERVFKYIYIKMSYYV